jgi:Tol biopolymer transport system component/imidazolonepropionase-like amidohydrolase
MSRLLWVALCFAFCGAAFAKQPSKPDSDAPWKIDAVHGPSSTVSFHTDEGTWLSLDVHPDGQRIVFSLLGDLYLLPIAGGEAKRITDGPAYDVQPRFSPDGKWIAFASDRGGIENLWVCDLEGKNARPITREKEIRVNGPAWSQGGHYLVGRKRLTDRSSIGTTELWMWHVQGGQGIRLTRKGEDPDVADPAFSRDRRFLYFSARDARYRYNRNVEAGIWQVKRLDRRTGQVVPVIRAFGGAAVPTFSPDGRTMAYVRRVRGKTRLELMDLRTGRLRTLAPEVERDEQEGFASHGVFPGFAFTPDGASVVAAAEGKIWRFDVKTGARSSVPFSASVEQRVTQALRVPRTLGGDSVRARILRWPVESPDGKRLVFSAAGHLYGMDLPSGAPERLTKLEDLEYAPSFSPSGKEIAFVTWNDQAGGHVWILPATGGGPPRRVTEVGGHYANPAFSPDGKKVAYVKGSGAAFRDRDLGEELWQELRWVEAEGGPGHLVTAVKNRGTNRRMPRPQFSPDGRRLFYLDEEKAKKPTLLPKSLLVSVQLDGRDRQVHLRFGNAEEAAISPDARWVVFNELHNAYVTALPDLGNRTVDLSLKKPALPLGQLTDEGGEWVAWADGGRTVTWIFGSTYHRLPLARALPPVALAEEVPKKDGKKAKKKPLPVSEAIDIQLSLPRAKPSGRVLYKGARLVTMRGDLVIERGAILVEADRMTAVGPEEAVAAPEGATVVDLSGKTIIPGLFDEHAHLHYSTQDIFPQRPWKYLANLAYGVTTTHDPSAATQEVFAQSEMVEAGLMVGPRIFSTGFILYGADNAARAIIHSLDDARHHVRRMKSLGAFSVKSYMQPARAQRQWILQAAREEQMMVVPEGGGDLEMDMTFVLDGHTTIEHALPVTPLRKDVVTLLAKSGTAYTPTLLVAYGGLFGEKWFHQHHEIWKDPRLVRHVPQGLLDTIGRRRLMAPDDDWHHLEVAKSARRVVDVGGRVCLGGHGQMQGLGPHWEIWAFVQAGMTPLQALRVATLSPAETLGMDRDLGSLEAGKLADFVVLAKNPLERIENTAQIDLVVKNGVAYRPEELARRPADAGAVP